MPSVQVILQGARVATHDVYDYPIILQFGEQKTYALAEWVLPNGMRVPTRRLSEIRTHYGSFSVLIDGPEGFQAGPYPTTWIRHYYPRGKDCALIHVDRDSGSYGGVSITVAEGSLFIEELENPKTTPPAQ